MPESPDIRDVYNLTKHSAQGNVFIIAIEKEDVDKNAVGEILDLRKKASFDWRSMKAKDLCNSRDGKADGLIFSSPVNKEGGNMDLYNADGSHAEISGNGARCLGQALAREREKAEDEIWATFQARNTRGGIRGVKKYFIYTENGREKLSQVKVKMMTPEILGSTVRTGVRFEVNQGDKFAEEVEPIFDEFDGLQGLCQVNVGNPHLILLFDEKNYAKIEEKRDGKIVANLAEENNLGELNVEFVKVVNKNGNLPIIRLKVFERGVGVTEACGSGAIASVAALNHLKKIDLHSHKKAEVIMNGGKVNVSVSREEIFNEPSGIKVGYRSPGERMDTTEEVYCLSGTVEFLGEI